MDCLSVAFSWLGIDEPAYSSYSTISIPEKVGPYRGWMLWKIIFVAVIWSTRKERDGWCLSSTVADLFLSVSTHMMWQAIMSNEFKGVISEAPNSIL